jgi:hypothetical protein
VSVITREIRKVTADIESTSDIERPRRVIPDFIVHRRGCDCYNVVVIEMKVDQTTIPCILLDWAKLAVFTDTEGDYPRYRFGLFLEITGKASTMAWLFDSIQTEVVQKIQL